MRGNTHLAIDQDLCGRPTEVAEGRAVVELTTLPSMSVDDRGLVHGGFVFGAADYAAMLAVADPNVVLGAAEVRFTKAVRVGQIVRCVATVDQVDRRKRVVRVEATAQAEPVFHGTFTAFVLDAHVLDG